MNKEEAYIQAQINILKTYEEFYWKLIESLEISHGETNTQFKQYITKLHLNLRLNVPKEYEFIKNLEANENSSRIQKFQTLFDNIENILDSSAPGDIIESEYLVFKLKKSREKYEI